MTNTFSTSSARSPACVVPAIFCIAMSVLIFEVALTRIFSVMLWYHFAYIVIGICLLGLGAAGSYLAATDLLRKQPSPLPTVARVAIAYPVSLIICFLIATHIRLEPLALLKEPRNILALFVIYIVLFIPFFLAGICLGFLISYYPRQISRLYCFDLLGAGTGALLAVVGVNFLGAPATLIAGALIASLAAYYFARLAELKRRNLIFILSLIILGLLMWFTRNPWPIHVPPSKELAGFPRDQIEYSKWSTIARVDVTRPGQFLPTFGGDTSPLFITNSYPGRFITQDGTAPTILFRIDQDFRAELPFLAATTQSAVYKLISRPRTLIIGVGGGIDVLVALYHNVTDITAVEVNPIMIDLITRRYAEFTNGIFSRPQIRFVANEGRHFLATTTVQYDIIQMSGVDTYAALSSGAYVLSESYLYTLDAIRDILNHLTPQGIYSVTRWYFDPPRETLRLAAISLEALESMGADHPALHLVILKGTHWGTILLKRQPWSELELQRLRDFCAMYQFDFFYDPGVPQDNVFNTFLRASSEQRARLIAQYPYDISIVTDNDPFFFQYYKWSDALRFKQPKAADLGYGISRLPLAHWTLIISIVQLLLLSIVLILLPLRRLRHEYGKTQGKVSFLIYFSSLGLGFIFIEIILIQKFIVYLGQPLYSLSLILAAILVFSGLGSLLTKTFTRNLYRKLLFTVALLSLLICFYSVGLSYLIHTFLNIPMILKALSCAVILFPLGVLMGMPFPLGIKIVALHNERLIPWIWGVNACLSVLGAMLCILLSSIWGFSAVLLVAALLYLIGMLCLMRTRRFLLTHTNTESHN